MSIGDIKKVPMFYIIYQLKFVSILSVICISLFGYNFIFSRHCNTVKIFKGGAITAQ